MALNRVWEPIIVRNLGTYSGDGFAQSMGTHHCEEFGYLLIYSGDGFEHSMGT